MLQNPNKDGIIIVEATGQNKKTHCYPGPTPGGMSQPYKVEAPIFPNGFNPKKIVFFGEEITVYAKNMTLQFHADGTVSTLPVNTWEGK